MSYREERKFIRIGDLFNLKNGYAFKSKNFTDEGIPVIKIKNVKPNEIKLENLSYVSKEILQERRSYVIAKNSLLITMSGNRIDGSPESWVGKVALFKNDGQFLLNQRVGALTPKNNSVDISYCAYCLASFNYQFHFINSANSSGGQANISPDIILNTEIPIPPLPTQTRIASILSAFDEKIEVNRQMNATLEGMAQAMFREWFINFEFPNEDNEPYKSSGGEMVDSELGKIPKGWGVGILDDLIDFSNGYAFKSRELLKEDIGDCYHVFKMGHIKKGGGLNADGTKSYYEKSKSIKLKKYVLRVGDLLMCMTDMKSNVALLGHTALMNENNKYIVNQRVGLLRPKNNLGIDFPYLYILTNSNAFIEDLRSRANSGVQVNLSTSEIKTSKVLLPPKEINIEFDNYAKAFFELIFKNEKENQALSKLRDVLLPKLMSGEIEV